MEHLLLLLSIIITLLFLYSTKPKKSIKLQIAPGPKPWPIIGNIHQLGDKPHQTLANMSKTYGPLMSLKLGSRTTIVISSPNVAKEMFLKHDLDFANRISLDVGKIDNHDKHSIVWLPVCPKWRHLRKIATIQLFTNQRLDASQDLRRNKVQEFIDFARNCCHKGLSIDVGKAAFTTSLNLLSNTFFSIDLCAYASSHSQEFRQIVWQMLEEGGKPNVSDFFPFFKHLDLQGRMRRIKVPFYKMVGTFEQIIGERLRNSSAEIKYDDVLATLLKLVEENELSLDDVKHVLLDLFVAGSDTTSSTVEWAMTELLREPEKMAKAQYEMEQHIGKGGFVEESDISKLPYIQAIVKETMRLHPPVPFLIPRKVNKDVGLCDFIVPKDAQVWVNVWSIGHDPSVWPNSESFVPERFLEGDDIDSKGRNFELIPFGAGRRICPGMPLAYRMVHLTLANLLHSFNWKPDDYDNLNPKCLDVQEKFGVTVQKLYPLHAVPLPRSST